MFQGPYTGELIKFIEKQNLALRCFDGGSLTLDHRLFGGKKKRPIQRLFSPSFLRNIILGSLAATEIEVAVSKEKFDLNNEHGQSMAIGPSENVSKNEQGSRSC